MKCIFQPQRFHSAQLDFVLWIINECPADECILQRPKVLVSVEEVFTCPRSLGMLEIRIFRGVNSIRRNMIESFKVGTLRKQLRYWEKEYTYVLYAFGEIYIYLDEGGEREIDEISNIFTALRDLSSFSFLHVFHNTFLI